MRRKGFDGFTIVEVSLVLGIAGLILLMVFIALPTLQRQARDAQRRDDVLMFINKLKNYQASNNRGALPEKEGDEYRFLVIQGNEVFSNDYTSGTWGDFYKKFFTNSFTDPSYDAPYDWVVMKCGAKNVSLNTGQNCPVANFNGSGKTLYDLGFDELANKMFIFLGASCNGSEAVYSTNTRNVAVLYAMESGGVFCANT